MSRLNLCAFALAALLAAEIALAAQSGIVVQGKVEDESGGAIVGARVGLTDHATKTARDTVTDQTGRFVFEAIGPGTYTVMAQFSEFQPAVETVVIGSEAPHRLKLVLKIAAAEEVTVPGTSAAAVNAASQNQDVIRFDDSLLRDLPLPSRSKTMFDFVGNFLSPAAQGTDELTISVDGAETTNLNIPVFAVRRVNINRDPYSPEYRRPGKARVEIITLDGSRRHYHGGGAMTLNSSSFDARDPFAAVKPDTLKRLGEWSFGGPLQQSTTFFISGERLVDREAAIVNAFTLDGPFAANVPSVASYTYWLGRFDYRPSPANVLTFRYDWGRDLQTVNGVGGFRLPELGIPSGQHQSGFQVTARSIGNSARLLSQTRLLLDRSTRDTGQAATGPNIVVNGAFAGGSPSRFRTSDADEIELQNTTTFALGSHTLRFGGGIRPKWLDAFDATEFGGAFEFANLDNYAAGIPVVYRVRQGDPDVAYTQHEANLFFQDEVALHPTLSLMAGVRYDWHNAGLDHHDPAPRLALSFAPGAKKTILRAGAGLFNERFASSITERTLMNDGVRTRELVISQPSYPDPFLNGSITIIPTSIVRLADDLQTPYLWQTTASIERLLWKRTVLTAEYGWVTGHHLMRSRNVNAPLPDTLVRPDPTLGNINEIQSTGSLHSHALSITFRGNTGKLLKATVHYTLATARDNTQGAEPGAGFPFAFPADNYNVSLEEGRADFDQRHRFTFAGVFSLPVQFKVGSVVSLASGKPYDITTGFDDNHDTIANDRPPGVTRNTGIGPGFAQIDLRLMKVFALAHPFGERTGHTDLQLNLDAFNAFNRTNYTNVVGIVSSPMFGRANSAKNPRSIQLSVKLSF